MVGEIRATGLSLAMDDKGSRKRRRGARRLEFGSSSIGYIMANCNGGGKKNRRISLWRRAEVLVIDEVRAPETMNRGRNQLQQLTIGRWMVIEAHTNRIWMQIDKIFGEDLGLEEGLGRGKKDYGISPLLVTELVWLAPIIGPPYSVGQREQIADAPAPRASHIHTDPSTSWPPK